MEDKCLKCDQEAEDYYDGVGWLCEEHYGDLTILIDEFLLKPDERVNKCL